MLRSVLVVAAAIPIMKMKTDPFSTESAILYCTIPSFLLILAGIIRLTYRHCGGFWSCAMTVCLAMFTHRLVADAFIVAAVGLSLQPIIVTNHPPYIPVPPSVTLDNFDPCERIGYQHRNGTCQWSGCIVDRVNAHDSNDHRYLNKPSMAECWGGAGFCDGGFCVDMAEWYNPAVSAFDRRTIQLTLDVNANGRLNAHERDLTIMEADERYYNKMDDFCSYKPHARILELLREDFGLAVKDVFLANGLECGYAYNMAACFQGKCRNYDLAAATGDTYVEYTMWPGTKKISLGYSTDAFSNSESD